MLHMHFNADLAYMLQSAMVENNGYYKNARTILKGLTYQIRNGIHIRDFQGT
jgi:hypothetical protein